MSHSLTANQLRWLGEAADSKRDAECEIIWKDDGNPTVVRRSEIPKGEKPLRGVDVKTPWSGKGMRGGATIQIVYNGKTVTLPPDVDTIFLNQTSVEKFVFPYYTRMKTPEWLVRKKKELFAPDIVIAVHRDPSITNGYKAVTVPLRESDDGLVGFDSNVL